MRKMNKAMAALMATAMTVGSLAGCGNAETAGTAETTKAADTAETTKAAETTAAETTAAASGETVTLRVWGAEEDQKMLSGMIDTFKAQYPDVNFDITLGVESESTAKDTVLTDIEAAADVYAFASDQLSDLVSAGALMCLDDVDAALQSYAGKSVSDIMAANNAGATDAALSDGKLYAFPMTADNGFFLFYNPEIVSAEDAKTWDTMLAAAEKGGKKVGMTLASGWYNASFFFGAGFSTGLNADGTTICDFNGTADYTGVQVTQAMLNIASNPAFMAIPDGQISGQIASGELCAVVTGVWDTAAVEEAFGENYGATKLPTYTIGDDQVQQGSFAGYKLVGVNPYSKYAGWAALLGEWLTNEENQQVRFAERQLGPSNLNVAASPEVQANKALAALAEQAAYGAVQLVGGKYWDPTATFGQMIAQGELKVDDEAGIQAALDNLVAGVTAPVE